MVIQALKCKFFRNPNFHDFSMTFPRKWNSMIFPYQGDFFHIFHDFPDFSLMVGSLLPMAWKNMPPDIWMEKMWKHYTWTALIMKLIPNTVKMCRVMGLAGYNQLGPDSIQTWHFTSIGNPIVEIRRSYDRLISTSGLQKFFFHILHK